MQNQFYTEEVNLKIYALISEDKFVFIGKTRGPLSGVFSRHICGRNAATRDYFGKQDPIRPQMHLLQRVCASQAMGYKHVLAYAYIFLQHGYVILNHEGTRAQLLDLHPETMQLVNAICSTPLETILKRSYLPKPSAADEDYVPQKPAPSRDEPLSTERLCIRMTEKEKNTFDAFAASLRFSQRDALLYMLRQNTLPKLGSEEWLRNQHISRSMKSCLEKVERLEKENMRLRQKWEKCSDATPQSTQSQKIAFIKGGIGKFFQRFESTGEDNDFLPTDKYRRFIDSLPSDINYEYPSEEGFMLFYPLWVLFGQSRGVRFILGIGEDEKHYRLRYYDKWDYIGPSLINKRFGLCDTCWLVGFRKAMDGAMDVVLSLPLNIRPRAIQPEPILEGRKPSLDSVIAEIQKNF